MQLTENLIVYSLLRDEYRRTVKDGKDELTKEIEEYKAYKEQLEKQFRALMGENENG